jgi:dihydrofolate reductase
LINIIVACDQNKLIGKNGKLPWDIKEDWDYFLKTTQKGILIMGRHCYDEFEDHAKNRDVIALSRNSDHTFPYAHKASNLAESLKMAGDFSGKTIWICGGRGIYEEALPLADRMYLTEINAEYSGNIYFPAWEKHFRKEVFSESLQTDSVELTFRILSK